VILAVIYVDNVMLFARPATVFNLLIALAVLHNDSFIMDNVSPPAFKASTDPIQFVYNVIYPAYLAAALERTAALPAHLENTLTSLIANVLMLVQVPTTAIVKIILACPAIPLAINVTAHFLAIVCNATTINIFTKNNV